MNKDELLKYSQKVKKDADRLLKETKVLEVLKKYGEIKISGSYKYDLMINEDVDIHIISDNVTRKRAVKFLNELIEETNVLGYMFFDWVENKLDKFPSGYYLGLNLIVPGYKKQWKIDIWLTNKYSENNTKYDKMFEKGISKENKILILDFKQKVRDEKLKIPSNEIYDAVLNKKVTKWEEFKKYYK